MKKLTVLTSVLVLAACGGGSGGGADVASNNIVRPSTLDVQASNANVSSSFSNADKRKTIAENNYAAAHVDFPTLDELHTNQNTPNNSPARQATSKKAFLGHSSVVTDLLIDALYANMYYWLIEDGGHTPTTLLGFAQYKHALILAGLIGLDWNNWDNMTYDDIADVVENSDIKDQAETLYTELGTLKTFDGTNIEWFSSPDNTGANDKITFHIDSENQKVTGITYVANENLPSRERTIEMTRQGDTNTYTANNVRLYQYGLNNIECIGPCPNPAEQGYENQTYDPEAHLHGGRNLDISLTEELTTTEQIKEKLLEEIQLAYEEGFFHSFHNALSEDDYSACDSGDDCYDGRRFDQDKVANKLRDAAIARVNNWEKETNKIEEHFDLNIENNLTTYGKLVGLAYSDFGTMDLTMTPDGFNQSDSKLIYGGYKDKKVETADITQSMEFYGVAKGQVHSSIERNHEDETIAEYEDIDLQDNNAKLVFNPSGKTETLTASFAGNNWYDIKVVKDSTNAPSITFTDNTEAGIDDKYKFIGHQGNTNQYTVNNFTQTRTDFNWLASPDYERDEYGNIVLDEHNNPVIVNVADDITGSANGTFGVAYYGDQEHHNPSEAVGFVTYQESEPYRTSPDNWEAERIKNVGFEVGFGMQKDITQ
jgi:hypothetical protein